MILKLIRIIKTIKFIKWVATTVTNSSHNNGGDTNYYDLPPASERPCIDDLIEHKKMERWRSEPFKTLYALEGRTERATDGSSSEERELHKCFYYLNRRMLMLKLEPYSQQSKSKVDK